MVDSVQEHFPHKEGSRGPSCGIDPCGESEAHQVKASEVVLSTAP